MDSADATTGDHEGPNSAPWAGEARLRDLFLRLLSRSTLSMVATCGLLLLGAVWSLYQTALEQREERLLLVADQQAELMNAFAWAELAHVADRAPAPLEASGEALALQTHAVREIARAYRRSPANQTAERLQLGRTRGDQIAYVLEGALGDGEAPVRVVTPTSADAPMQRALLGQRGVMLVRDREGRALLAAYRPVLDLGLGIVCSAEVEAVRAPYIAAAQAVGFAGLLLIVLGAASIMVSASPLLRRVREGEEHLRRLIQHAPEALVVYDADLRVIVETNAIAPGLFGRSREELLAARPGDLFGAPDARDGPIMLAHFEDAVAEALAREGPVGRELRIQTAAGARYLGMRLVALPSSDRRLLCATFVDQSESHEQAREARLVADAADLVVAHGPLLLRLERGMRRIEEEVRHAGPARVDLWTLEPSGDLHLTASSRPLCVGQSQHAGPGESELSLVDGQVCLLSPRLGWSPPGWCRANGFQAFSGFSLGVASRRLGVLTVYSSDTLAPSLCDALERIAERVSTVLAHYQAHAKLVAAKEAAEEANTKKSDFLASLSHEIRTPMHGTLGFGKLLQDTELTGRQRSWVNAIVSSSKMLLSLVDEVLDLSRIEAGEVPLEPTDVRLDLLLREVATLVEPRADERSLRITTDLAPDAKRLCFRVDELRLRQVLLNLLGNAVKYAIPGVVTVRARVHPSPVEGCRRVVLEVEDEGPGIPKNQLERIFGRFQQSEASGGAPAHGTGLGLAIARQLAERLGATLTVDSARGRGSTFRVAFEALSAREVDVAVVPEVRSDPLAASEPLSILYADDHELNRLLVDSYFADSPHRLLLAENGEEAVAIARAERPDAIVLDLRMPILDGVQALEQIRAFSDAPVLVLTASSRREVDALGARFDAVLQKPIEPDDLALALREALDAKRSPEPVSLSA